MEKRGKIVKTALLQRFKHNSKKVGGRRGSDRDSILKAASESRPHADSITSRAKTIYIVLIYEKINGFSLNCFVY